MSKKKQAYDLQRIKPLTPAQEHMFLAYEHGQHVVGYGSAGTGKSYVALYLALRDLLNYRTNKQALIIVRSAVPTRDIGFLPGTLEEKMAVYEQPYADIFADLLGVPDAYDEQKRYGGVEFHTTSFLRSLTWNDCIIVVDECQSMTFHEINSVVTRVGENSRVILLGDFSQTDLLHERSGMAKMLRVAEKMHEFTLVKFNNDDIVRSPFVKAWLIASDYDGATPEAYLMGA